MIVEMALKDFFDEASEVWIVDDEGGDPIVFHADSFLDMVSGTAMPAPKVAVPVTKEMINGEVHHCAVMPAAKAAPASTVKTISTKVKTLMNLAAPATVDTPATKVCSKDITKVIAHAKATVHPAAAKVAPTKAVHSGATYLATGAAVAATLFAMA